MSPGEEIFEIHFYEGALYINRDIIKRVSNKGRLICRFGVYNGLKPGAINQFTRQYRCWWERGNHLNMFRMISLKPDLERNISRFSKCVTKVSGLEVPPPIFN